MATAANDPLAGLASLINTIGGTRQTQTSNPGDISYLQTVFNQGQQFDPNMLLQTIFQQAQGQIPGFQRAFGNAMGARSGNNSAVSAALQKLLMDTSVAAQQQMSNQILQNNQQQGAVAGGIANATKGTTQTTKSGTDLARVGKLLGAMQLAGKLGLTDQLTKSLGLPGSTGSMGANVGSAMAPQAAIQQANSSMAPAAVTSPVSAGTMSAGLSIPDPTGDIFSQPGMGSMDWTGGATLADGFSTFSDMFADQANNLAIMENIDPMDALMATTDGFGTIESGANFLDSITDVGSSLFDWLGFADGGLVGRDGAKEAKKAAPDEEIIESSSMRRYDAGNTNNQVLDLIRALMPAYADGGPVRGPQRVNTMQSANPITTGAVNMQSAPMQRPTQRPVIDPGTGTGITLQELAGIGSENSSLSGVTASPESLAAIDDALGSIAGTFGSMAGGTLAGALGLGPLGTAALSAAGKGFVNSAVNANQGITAVNAANNAMAAGGYGTGNGGGFNSSAGISVGDPGVANDFGAISTGVMGNGIGPGIDLGVLGADAGMGGGNGGDAAGLGVGAGDASSSDAGFGGTLANGGEVSGPGTGTSDSIIAKLSDGEYVISADVVDKIGVDFFDLLQKQYHTPVAKKAW